MVIIKVEMKVEIKVAGIKAITFHFIGNSFMGRITNRLINGKVKI